MTKKERAALRTLTRSTLTSIDAYWQHCTTCRGYGDLGHEIDPITGQLERLTCPSCGGFGTHAPAEITPPWQLAVDDEGFAVVRLA